MKKLLAMLSLAAAAGVAAQPATVDPTLDEQARRATWLGDTAELDRLHQAVRTSPARDAQGVLGLHVLRRAVLDVLDGPRDPTEAYFAEMEAFTLQWARERPRSTLAHTAHLEALLDRAWFHRGTGYANTVPPHAWREFESNVERAARYAAAQAEALRADSTAYPALVTIAAVSGAGADRVMAIGREGLQRNPEDHWIYLRTLNWLLPKWGGDARLVDRWIREAESRTRTSYGKALYALLYAEAAARQFEHALFTDSAASWPDLRDGYRDVLARWPTPEHISRFAYFACLARDMDTWHELAARATFEPRRDEWGPNPRQMLDGCKRWASRQ